MERERTFNPSACGSKPPGSANLEIIGPVTVAAERRGLLIRWLAPTAGSNPAWSSILLRAEALRRTFARLGAKQDPSSPYGLRRAFSSGPPKLQQRRVPFEALAKKGASAS